MQSGPLHGGYVYKNILAAVIGLDKAITFCTVEKFDGSFQAFTAHQLCLPGVGSAYCRVEVLLNARKNFAVARRKAETYSSVLSVASLSQDEEMKFCFHAVFPVVLAAGFLAVHPAQARPVTKTRYTYYPISGKTAASLYRQMVTRGPHVSGSRAFAATRALQNYQRSYVDQRGRCRVKNFKMKISFTISLPRLSTRSGMSARTLKTWRRFSVFVKRHELKHRSIWLACARSIERRVRSVRATSCPLAEEKVTAIIRQEQRRCDRDHDLFDAADQRRLARHPLVIAARAVKRRERKRGRVTTWRRTTLGLHER